MLFSLSVLFMFRRLQKSRENRTCTDVLFIEYPHDLISDWLNSSKTYMSDKPNRNKFYSVCQHICRMFSQFTRYVLSSALKHICKTYRVNRANYTICFDRHVSKQTKRHIAHTRVYTVCLTELPLNSSLQNNCLCLHNLNMEEDNFVIPACMLVIAAFCLMNMNLSVSDGVKLNSSFRFLCRILNQVAKFFIETETH